jgi:3,4-dihydroxy-2-butanone 4-phosphate synthase
MSSKPELARLRHGFLSTPEEVIEEARNGRMFILVDDEDRENEGDLIIPAQMATPDAINFMATHGRGLICLALTKARVDQLGLPQHVDELVVVAFEIADDHHARDIVPFRDRPRRLRAHERKQRHEQRSHHKPPPPPPDGANACRRDAAALLRFHSPPLA